MTKNKFLSLLLALALSCALFTACGGDSSSQGSSGDSSVSSGASTADEHTLRAILAAVEEVTPVQEGKEVDSETLSLLMNINMDNVEAYVAKVTQLNQNTDRVIVLLAKPGMAAEVQADLEAHRDDLIASAANYAEFAGEKVKAENARIAVRGDIVVLVVIGDSEAIQADGGPEAIYGPIDAALDAIL